MTNRKLVLEKTSLRVLSALEASWPQGGGGGALAPVISEDTVKSAKGDCPCTNSNDGC